jgi:hypothetical protein
MIDSVSPAGFERFFRELSDMTAVGAPDRAAIVALAERYELPFAEPDWLPDVISTLWPDSADALTPAAGQPRS